ncbi:Phosphatidylserine synthase 2 [Orchesella cincta]|uniref:Phosphatidylserine synthase n=1 Tax=Orchesella cincta TaxID=48709 RepID=A0A1D2M4B8_ORCCI|nr:Phosphatidylserine synthase 2 [Orchesella cincta]
MLTSNWGTLLEKSYGGNCLSMIQLLLVILGTTWDKFDLFVPLHFFGWWLKTLVLSGLVAQLWILDALVCNGGGILLGMLTLKYFRVRTYEWRGLWNIPDYTGKIKRVLAQFGPHSWIEFDWKPTSSFGRWMAVLGITFVFLVAELNTFYLKFVFGCLLAIL